MNDNAKPNIFRRVIDWIKLKIAYVRGWMENSWIYRRLEARKYDAPERSWWWLVVRGLALIAILVVTHGMAFQQGKDRAIVVVGKVAAPNVVIGGDSVPKFVAVAWKDRALTCEAAAAELTRDNSKMRAALNALPKPPDKIAPAVINEAPKPIAGKAPPKAKACDTWLCKVDKLVTDPSAAVGLD